jgi:riboflavin synthase
MFTGIVKGVFKVAEIDKLPGLTRLAIQFTEDFIENLQIGASVSINGVCLTVVKIEKTQIYFDLIDETLQLTNLKNLVTGQDVNAERSAKFGDEIGGHILSGHVFGTCPITQIEASENNYAISLKAETSTIKYLFKKGYVALNGTSLTIVSVDKNLGIFTVHLIPETLRSTTFLQKQIGDEINLEIDYQTQVIVDTIQAHSVHSET